MIDNTNLAETHVPKLKAVPLREKELCLFKNRVSDLLSRCLFYIVPVSNKKEKMLTQTLLLFGHRNEKDVFFCSVLKLEPVKGELG